eukprot:1688807-Karenia_brevis.AAC.1
MFDPPDSNPTATTQGSKRPQISPTQPVAPVLPSPFGGDSKDLKAEVERPKLQEAEESAGKEKIGQESKEPSKDADMEPADPKPTQRYEE